MKNRFFGLLIVLFLGLICSCGPIGGGISIPPARIFSQGATIDELLENYKISIDEVFAREWVKYELKNFYGSYYLPNMDKLSKYNVYPFQHPSLVEDDTPKNNDFFCSSVQLIEKELFYDYITQTIINDYYLLGEIKTIYLFDISDSVRKYNIKVIHYSNNCYTTINIEDRPLIHKQQIYYSSKLFSFDDLIQRADGKFDELLVLDKFYFESENGDLIRLGYTELYITPVKENPTNIEEDVRFNYRDFLYLYSDEYTIPPQHEFLKSKITEFYNEVIITTEKIDLCVEK